MIVPDSAARLATLARRVHFWQNRHLLAMTAYALIAAASYLGAFLLRFDLRWPTAYADVILVTLPLAVAVRSACSWGFRLSTGRWRFVSTGDVVRLVAATATGSLLLYLISLFLPITPRVPRSVLLIEALLTTWLTAGAWIGYRVGFEQLRHLRAAGGRSIKRVLIVGAGEAGSMLAREMRRFPTGYRVVGFVDDDPRKLGTSLHGASVLGATEELSEIAASTRADQIVIAIPSAPPAELRRTLAHCDETELPFKVLPGIAEVLAGDVRINHLRDLKITDLLGREPIELELPQVERAIRERCVMITGAAGSIGSELARQIALHRPQSLVLVDQAETPLFYLEAELKETCPDLRLNAVIADVVDAGAVEQVMADYAPAWIFHAAAYKHVPLMELNARAAIRNNVLGTWEVASAAGRQGSEKFVLVSTDKAVSPANVMGATKRTAELVILELQERYPETMYSAVRFGNVLGSSGSVIPIFERQLEAKRPLTVTHPDVTRYFMTIPEAVQLILQASLLHELRGQVAMLDMGEPVRIVDLARNMLRLSGHSSVSGRDLRFTGLRPGEKLHERLIADDESTEPTDIPKVHRVRRRNSATPRILEQVEAWAELLGAGKDEQVLAEFGELHRLAIRRSSASAVAAALSWASSGNGAAAGPE